MCNSIKKLVQKEQLQLIQKGILSIGDKLPEFVKKAVISTKKAMKNAKKMVNLKSNSPKNLCVSGSSHKASKAKKDKKCLR